VVDEGFAKSIGLKVEDDVKLLTNRISATKFTIVGLIRPKSGAMAVQMAMAFMPLDRAQYYFSPRKRNAIDKIQVVTPPNSDPEKIRPLIADILRTVAVKVIRGQETLQLAVTLPGKTARSDLSRKESISES